MAVFESLSLKLQVRVIPGLVLVTQTEKWCAVYELLKRLFNDYVNSR